MTNFFINTFDSIYFKVIKTKRLPLILLIFWTLFLNAQENFEGVYQIINVNSNKCVSVPLGSNIDGVPLVQWNSTPGYSNLQWNVKKTNDGYYYIISESSGKCIDVYKNYSNNGAVVAQWQIKNGDNQKWSFRKISDGIYNIVSKQSGKNLDVSGGTLENGANIMVWENNGAKNQQWKLVKNGNFQDLNCVRSFIDPKRNYEISLNQIPSKLFESHNNIYFNYENNMFKISQSNSKNLTGISTIRPDKVVGILVNEYKINGNSQKFKQIQLIVDASSVFPNISNRLIHFTFAIVSYENGFDQYNKYISYQGISSLDELFNRIASIVSQRGGRKVSLSFQKDDEYYPKVIACEPVKKSLLDPKSLIGKKFILMDCIKPFMLDGKLSDNENNYREEFEMVSAMNLPENMIFESKFAKEIYYTTIFSNWKKNINEHNSEEFKKNSKVEYYDPTGIQYNVKLCVIKPISYIDNKLILELFFEIGGYNKYSFDPTTRCSNFERGVSDYPNALSYRITISTNKMTSDEFLKRILEQIVNEENIRCENKTMFEYIEGDISNQITIQRSPCEHAFLYSKITNYINAKAGSYSSGFPIPDILKFQAASGGIMLLDINEVSKWIDANNNIPVFKVWEKY